MLKNIVLLATFALATTACSKDKAAPAEGEVQTGSQAQTGEADNSAGSAGHAPKDVQPGSHEDWCGEHGVAESQCTRCNSDLTAAFKATGDWCDTHGLPDSQCLKCNPDLEIVRPPPAPAHE